MQFDRKVTAQVDIPGRSEGLQYEGFRMVFHIEKTSSSDPNKATLEIYNLSRESRDFLDSVQKSRLTIRAGYADEPDIETIFKGTITLTSHRATAPDIATIFEAADGKKELREDTFSKSFGENVSALHVFDEILKELKWDRKTKIKDVNKIIQDVRLGKGFTWNGLGKDALDQLSDILKFNWSFQNEAVKIIVSGVSNDVIETVVLSAETGMIGVPEKSDKDSVRTKKLEKEIEKQRKNEPGFVVTSLLKPKAEPGGLAFLKSEVLGIDSRFPIGDVVHDGDNFGQPWTSKIKCLISPNQSKQVLEAQAGVLA